MPYAQILLLDSDVYRATETIVMDFCISNDHLLPLKEQLIWGFGYFLIG